ncbi:MAG: hypothetical protein WC528_00735 [Patescibacteria group bacterium]
MVMNAVFDFFKLFGALVGFMLAWLASGFLVAWMALIVKSFFKPSGQRLTFLKEAWALKTWFCDFAKLGPASLIVAPVSIFLPYNPRADAERLACDEFLKSTQLGPEHWWHYGHREMYLDSAQRSIENLDHNLASVGAAIETVPAQTKRWAWVTATCAFLMTSMRTGLVFAADFLSSLSAKATTVETVSQKEKPLSSASGFLFASAIEDEAGERIRLEKLNLRGDYRRGRIFLTGQYDFAAKDLKLAKIGFDYPELKVLLEAGRMATPFGLMHLSPAKSPFIRIPLDQLGPPMFDNGCLVSFSGRHFETRAGFLNGSGGLDDDNAEMDGVGQVFLKSRFGSFGAVFERGRQAKAMREVLGLNAETRIGRLRGRCLFVSRPDLKADGFMANAVLSAGPVEAVGQYEKTRGLATDSEILEVGVNRKIDEGGTLLGHAILARNAPPVFQLQLKYLF